MPKLPQGKTEKEHDKLILHYAKSNHIWVSCFARQTPEMLQDIGKMVVDMLNTPDNLIAAHSSENETMGKTGQLTPVLYLYVNRS